MAASPRYSGALVEAGVSRLASARDGSAHKGSRNGGLPLGFGSRLDQARNEPDWPRTHEMSHARPSTAAVSQPDRSASLARGSVRRDFQLGCWQPQPWQTSQMLQW